MMRKLKALTVSSITTHRTAILFTRSCCYRHRAAIAVCHSERAWTFSTVSNNPTSRGERSRLDETGRCNSTNRVKLSWLLRKLTHLVVWSGLSGTRSTPARFAASHKKVVVFRQDNLWVGKVCFSRGISKLFSFCSRTVEHPVGYVKVVSLLQPR